MSAIDRRPEVDLPPLVDGQRLDRATFHERYAAMPRETRAELIGGVVSMMSPMRSEHGRLTTRLGMVVSLYHRDLAGVASGGESTVLLDDQAELQPDLHLRLDSARGGRSTIDSDGYVTGPPELVIEVAAASKARDLGPKLADYERAGVLEYLVIALDPKVIHQFVRNENRFVPRTGDADGIVRSETFPGLWIASRALFADDIPALIATVEQGRDTPEFAAFRERLASGRA